MKIKICFIIGLLVFLFSPFGFSEDDSLSLPNQGSQNNLNNVYTEDLQDKVDSSAERAAEAAEKQQLAAYATAAGAGAAAMKAKACFSSCAGFGGNCTPCYGYAALAAGLGGATLKLNSAAEDNRNIANEYSNQWSHLLSPGNNPQPTDNNPRPPNSPEQIFPIDNNNPISSGGPLPPGNNPALPGIDLQKANTPSPVTLPGGDKLVPTPKGLDDFLKKQNVKFDSEKGSITMPGGQTATAKDMDKPGFKDFLASTSGAAFQNQLEGLKKQIAASSDSEGGLETALEDGGEDSDISLGGGGGYAGYSAGGKKARRGGGGALMPNSAFGSRAGGQNLSNRVAGMSIKAGRDRVGVASDNIFEMIHRRYQMKRKQKQFIETE